MMGIWHLAAASRSRSQHTHSAFHQRPHGEAVLDMTTTITAPGLPLDPAPVAVSGHGTPGRKAKLRVVR